MQVWSTWCLRQIVTMHNLAVRQTWRDRAFQAAIHGAEVGPEPEWDLGKHIDGRAHDDEFESMKRRNRGR
jgi:hypothetical protein